MTRFPTVCVAETNHVAAVLADGPPTLRLQATPQQLATAQIVAAIAYIAHGTHSELSSPSREAVGTIGDLSHELAIVAGDLRLMGRADYPLTHVIDDTLVRSLATGHGTTHGNRTLLRMHLLSHGRSTKPLIEQLGRTDGIVSEWSTHVGEALSSLARTATQLCRLFHSLQPTKTQQTWAQAQYRLRLLTRTHSVTPALQEPADRLAIARGLLSAILTLGDDHKDLM